MENYATLNSIRMKLQLPLGNGRLGCMVFGGTDTEHIQFNEDSLWIGDEADAKWCMGNNRQPVLWLMHCSYIEIKKTASPGSKDIRSFSVLQRQNTVVGHGAVICLAQRRLPITREVDSVPIGEL